MAGFGIQPSDEKQRPLISSQPCGPRVNGLGFRV